MHCIVQPFVEYQIKLQSSRAVKGAFNFPFFSLFRCNLRILDSFGTDAEFNYAEYGGLPKEFKTKWANVDVHLRQIMTMFRKIK